MKRRWFYSLFSRRVSVIVLLLLQVFFFIYLITAGSRASLLLNLALRIISVLVTLYIMSKKEKGAFKAAWIILILSFPLFGGLLYLMFYLQTSSKRFAPVNPTPELLTASMISLPGDSYEEAEKQTGGYFPQFRYLQDYVGYPVYSDTSTQFFASGEEMFGILIRELEKAEKYIFLEFFIIQEGKMWNTILDILKEKAKQGIEVRLIYDDMGCFLLLPSDYPKKLKELGISCMKFNKFRPMLTIVQNNRDHRKIVSIDGKTAFTGGVNLADEYINAVKKYGHWRDSGIMLKGKAAWSLSVMFLQMWQLCAGQEERFTRFYPWKNAVCPPCRDGFVQPYADSPMDDENIGEHVYLQIMSQAQDYVYINTPYLVVDDSMVSALTLAAKRGVDVRIMTPHKWDKWVVHMTTRSYYRELIKAGVKIYEYTAGFNHSKTFVSDDCIGTVGTINLDFRSLYLHFECGVLMYGSCAIMQMKEDFLNVLPSCRQITEQDCHTSVPVRLLQDVLRLFAPLM